MGKFDLIAKRYDTEERIQGANIIADKLRTYIQNSAEKTAIDYGCGTGLVGLQLTDLFQSVLFIDSSGPMIEQLDQKIKAAGIENARTLCCDLAQAEQSGLQADYIILSQVLLHIKDTEVILSRLFHLLNTGGHLLIVDFNKEESIISDEIHNGFVQEELFALLKKIGFSKTKAETFHHGKNLLMNQEASLFILDSKK